MPLPAHVDTPGNMQGQDNFTWTEDEIKQANVILSKYPPNFKQSAMIPLLYIAQANVASGKNFLPLAGMNAVAKILECHPMKVYEVASFYSMFNRKRVGKFHLQVCGTTPCMVRGSDDVIQACRDHLGIEKGETTADGLFTLNEVECLAACANAPMMQINNEEMYEDLNYNNTKILLDDLKAGKARVGPQPNKDFDSKPEHMTGDYKRVAAGKTVQIPGGPPVGHMGEETTGGYVRNTCEGPYGRANLMEGNPAKIWEQNKTAIDQRLAAVIAEKNAAAKE